MDPLESKSAITGMKISLVVFNSRFKQGEERIMKLEYSKVKLPSLRKRGKTK